MTTAFPAAVFLGEVHLPATATRTSYPVRPTERYNILAAIKRIGDAGNGLSKHVQLLSHANIAPERYRVAKVIEPKGREIQ
jgi:hypothetical protein